MNVAFWPYALTFRHSNIQRYGALLRFQFPDGLIGYADCHPWVELGDDPLQKQLSLLSQSVTTPITERSKYFARLDAKARTKKLNIFSNLEIPSSHMLVMDQSFDLQSVIQQGFTRIKLKVTDTTSLKYLLPLIPDNLKLRLDFNSKISKESFQKCLDEILPWLSKIDFIEDPFPFDSSSWKAIQQQYKVSLARDHGSQKSLESDSHDVIIIKPAKQDVRKFEELPKRLVITSYLDHPLGQLGAAFFAAKLAPEVDVCGLLSHCVYQTNEFSEQIENHGPYLIPPQKGTGFGFDHILSKLEWKNL